MLYDETLLWSKLESYSIDNPNEDLTFSQRLARENDWTATYTGRVITEYKKFLFLCVISPHPVTPSDEVDQAWHLHLVYTKSYWNDLCQNILGKDIHHTPTAGGPTESEKFVNYYEATLALYEQKFHTIPDSDIWPIVHKRFGDDDFIRANKKTHWIIQKRTWHKGITGLSLMTGGGLISLVTANIAFAILFGFAGLIVFVKSLNLTYGWTSTQNGDGSGCGMFGCGGDSGCNGGHSGCGGDSGCSGGCSGGCGGGCGGGD